jgi:signal peptidase I
MTELANKKSRLIGALTDKPMPVTIRGDCMAPLLNDGDRVMIKRSRYYMPGDILVYCNSSGDLISHRMLGYYFWKGEWRLLIKADNVLKPDGGVAAHHVLGKVQSSHPGFRMRLRSFGFFLRFTLAKIISI